MVLEDYKDFVASTAAICTMGHMLSGTLVCKDIYKKGTAEGFDAKPFVGGIGIGILMLQYAFILNDSAMITVNLFGLSTSISYVIVFYIYATNKADIVALIAKTVGIASLFLAYSKIEKSEHIEFRFGLLTTVLLLLLISTPLMNLGQVIKTKSTEILPFPMIIMGTIVSSQWLLYGVIIDNSFIVFQNAVGLGLYAIQLSLFAIFPSKSAATSRSDVKED